MPTVPTYGSPQVQETGLPNSSPLTPASDDTLGGDKSQEKVTTAADTVLTAGQKVMSDELAKANQVANLSADTALSTAATQIQIQVSKMQGKDALGAPDVAQTAWKKVVDDQMANASSDQQRMFIQRVAPTHYNALDKTTQMHVSGQMSAYDDSETQSSIDASRSAAVLNAFDPDRVAQEVDKQQAVYQMYAQRKGIPEDSEQYKTGIGNVVSATHEGVINSQLDNDQVDKAREYFDANKDQMNAASVLQVQKKFETADTLEAGNEAWNQTQGMKLPDGTPDEQKMRATIMADPDLSDERKLKVWDFVKARSAEQVGDDRRNTESNNREFMNEVTQARKQGVSLTDALKIPDDYAKDSYDTNLKQKQVREIYAPPTDSNSAVKVPLWTGIRSGTVKQTQIDDAFHRDDLNVKDHDTLTQDLFKAQEEGVPPANRLAWKYIQEEAATHFGTDKKNKEDYLNVVQQQSQGKTADEMKKISVDAMAVNPKTKTWWPWSGDPQYQSDIKGIQADALAMGKMQQDVGASQVAAISQGIQQSTRQEKVGLADIDAFAARFGGHDAIKVGTPVNNAIQSCQRAGVHPTPANIDWVLSKSPNGIYNKATGQ